MAVTKPIHQVHSSGALAKLEHDWEIFPPYFLLISFLIISFFSILRGKFSGIGIFLMTKKSVKMNH